MPDLVVDRIEINPAVILSKPVIRGTRLMAYTLRFLSDESCDFTQVFRKKKRGQMIEENKRVIHRFLEEFWNQGQTEILDELVAPNCIAWDQPFGPEGFKQLFTNVRTAFPDLQFQIEDMIAADDKVVVRFVEHGTHQGLWFDIPPTGKTIRVPGIVIFRLTDGKIVQQWSHNDFGSEMEQLGARIVPGDG